MSFENTHNLSEHLKNYFKKPLNCVLSSGDLNIDILTIYMEKSQRWMNMIIMCNCAQMEIQQKS